MKRAVASFAGRVLLRRVAAAAAHQVAAADSDWRSVTLPSLGPPEVAAAVTAAERRRRLVVDEISRARRLVVHVGRDQVELLRQFVAVAVARIARVPCSEQ